MDPYAFLALRVKSDGRRYTINVQTESIVETDIHQHRLYSRHHKISHPPPSDADADAYADADVPPALSDIPPPSISSASASATTTPNPDSTGWETILVRWGDFVRTNHGMVVEPQTGLIKQKIKSIGIGLTDRIEGPYELCIHRMWGTNGISGEEIEEERRICGEDALDLAAEATGERSVAEREGKGMEKLKGLKKLGKEWDR
jgi:NADH dehydrogenase [ubiquinone] 1 alpha subcomplex assembly factor 1